jgi:hypothetical protein
VPLSRLEVATLLLCLGPAFPLRRVALFDLPDDKGARHQSHPLPEFLELAITSALTGWTDGKSGARLHVTEVCSLGYV